MRPELEIVKGVLAGRRFTVTEKGLRLGRSSSNDIHISDLALSRSHCLFEPAGESGIRVTDLASANGTLLNGNELGSEPVDLKPGDEIEAGATKLRVVLDGVKVAAQPSPVADLTPVNRWRRANQCAWLVALGLGAAVAVGWWMMRSQPSSEAPERSPSAEAEEAASSVRRGESPRPQTVEPPLPHGLSVLTTTATASVEKPVEKVATGSLLVQTEPVGAMVKVNGKARGLTPLTVSGIPAGCVTVSLARVGFEDAVSEVEVKADDRQLLSVALKKLPAPSELGRIEVRTDPVGALVLVDGRPLGETVCPAKKAAHSEAFPVENIAEGEHTLVVRKAGYVEVLRRIKVQKGQTAMANVRLKPSFSPNVEIVTSRGKYSGVLKAETPETVDLEVSPGITRTFPRKEIEKMTPLRKAE